MLIIIIKSLFIDSKDTVFQKMKNKKNKKILVIQIEVYYMFPVNWDSQGMTGAFKILYLTLYGLNFSEGT